MASRRENPVRVGPVNQTVTATGRVSGFEIEVWHDGLGEHQVLRDRNFGVLQNKVQALQVRWAEKYKKHIEGEAREQRHQAHLKEAADRTVKAQEELEACRNILAAGLGAKHRPIWESLKKPLKNEPMTSKAKGTSGIKYDDKTGRPLSYVRAVPQGDGPPKYTPPKFTFLDHLSSDRKTRKELSARLEFEKATEWWQQESNRVQYRNAELVKVLDAEKKDWAEREAAFKERQNAPLVAANAKVDALRNKYEHWDREDAGPIEYQARLVLDTPRYLDWIKIDYQLGYLPEAKTVVVNYRLPGESLMPTIQSVTYVKSRDELQQKFISKRELEQLYDSVLHQIALRTIHELFSADAVKAFDAVVFNGWVDGVNPATGRSSNSCILSVQAQREEFLAIDLKAVEPRACFRALKGVSAAKLATLTPVRPVLQLDTNDRRFVQSRDVTQDLSDESNLATMDWEDFEHLVREIFEKEFVSEGGEVKVTQASRDGGVDAIAFDPDPIRGGKYVIQAKRYTRTVSVSAVRELHGTVINEGANRGILVTTSDYGADSVGYAKDKPLTLINGSQLLSLLEKHGHQARIDIGEARAMQVDLNS